MPWVLRVFTPYRLAGRLMLMSSYLHVAFMLAGGTTTSVTKWSDKFNFNKHNNWQGCTHSQVSKIVYVLQLLAVII